MTTVRSLQEELDKERALQKSMKDRIALQNRELEALRGAANQNVNGSQAHLDTNDLLAQLVTNIKEGILIEDENRKIILANKEFCKQFGITNSPETIIGADFGATEKRSKHLFKNPDLFLARIDQLLKDKKTILNDELELVSGQVFYRDYIPVFSNGNYKGHLWKYTDVTRNKTIESTFESQRNFYEQILNNIPADIAVFSSDHRYMFANPMAIGNPDLRKWVIGKNDEEYCKYTNRPLSIADTRNKIFNSVKESRTQVEWEERLNRADGKAEYHLRKMYPVLDNNGEVEIVIGYGVDITERKKIEDHIKLSEKRYREIFSYSQAWICTHDMQGNILTINPAACKILDYKEDKLIGQSIDSLMPEKVRTLFSESYLKKIMTEGKAEGIMSILNRAGKTIYLLYQNYLLNEQGSEPYVIGFAQNITERIFAEEALKRSEEKYRGIIENMNLGMMEMDNEERIIYANQRFCNMSGYTLEELISKKATDLFLEGSNLKITRNQLSKRQFGITKSYELAIKTKSGDSKWWLTSAAPLFNPDQTMKGTIGIHLDITEQKRLEEQLKDAKADADRSTKSKDIFLTNMSHEIRTPLNAIMGLGKLLGKSILNTQQKQYLTGIASASENLLGIINDLLDFSKIEAGKITIENISFNLGAACDQVISILTHKAEEKGLVLTSELDERISPILIGDPYRINQVFMNMLSNAIKFTEKGSIYLKAFLLEEAEGWQKILVIIEDTGVGIKEEYLGSIFDKFTQEDETVVRKFGGTGLGMSITKQIIELMGGSITVNSKKNVGTTISLIFNFKIGTSRVIEKKKTIKNETSTISGKKILLVEDNNLNRLLAYTILTEYGAIVAEAENGLEAIEMMKNDTFDLVLMDIQMPVMDGIKATKIIRKEINNTIPILALTANAIKGKENQFLEAGMDDFIYKPYNEINLVNPISKWLNKNTDAPDPTLSPTPAPMVIEHIPQLAEAVAPPPPVNTSLFDLSKLEKIGSEDFVIRMLKLFVNEVPPSVINVKKAYKIGDFETIKYLIHRMRPSIQNLGISQLKDEIVQIEDLAAKAEKTVKLEQMIEKLERVINLVSDKLRQQYNL